MLKRASRKLRSTPAKTLMYIILFLVLFLAIFSMADDWNCKWK